MVLCPAPPSTNPSKRAPGYSVKVSLPPHVQGYTITPADQGTVEYPVVEITDKTRAIAIKPTQVDEISQLRCAGCRPIMAIAD